MSGGGLASPPGGTDPPPDVADWQGVHPARPPRAGEAGATPALPRNRVPASLVSRNTCRVRFSTRRGLRVAERPSPVLEFAARPVKVSDEFLPPARGATGAWGRRPPDRATHLPGRSGDRRGPRGRVHRRRRRGGVRRPA